jgi:hypothetical protein
MTKAPPTSPSDDSRPRDPADEKNALHQCVTSNNVARQAN